MILKLLLAAGLWLAPSAASAPSPAPSIIEVRMVDIGGAQWRFSPELVEARPGDVIRFVQDDIVPHNVEFKVVPSGAELGPAKMGPFLLQKGDTYDLTLDGRFSPGTYEFVCTPHEVVGMKATLTIITPPPIAGDQQ